MARFKLQRLNADLVKWYRNLIPRERALIVAAGGVLLFIVLYTVTESVVLAFSGQHERLQNVEKSLQSVPPLLQQYYRLERLQQASEQQFSQATTQSAMLAHLEAVIKRRAKVQSRFEIRRGDEAAIGQNFSRLPFAVTFQQITPGELSDFLKEISTDRERPAMISKLSLTARGSSLRAEVSLDLIIRRS